MFRSQLGLRAPLRLCMVALVSFGSLWPDYARAATPSILFRVSEESHKLEMTVNSSRLLTLEDQVPRVQVNNKDVLDVTPLSPNQIQIFAKKTGVTQVNLWTADGRIHTVDVSVKGDSQELTMVLKREFPHSTIRVEPTSGGVILAGYVGRADEVNQMIQIASEYYPKVIPHIQVGGVQQILLKVKVAEVSRTKLGAMGTDFAVSGPTNNFFVSGVSGLIDATAAAAGTAGGAGDQVRFGFVDGNTKWFTFLEFLQKNDLVKVLAEPNLTTVSGRPAYFQAGGEFPVLIPQSLGTVSIEYKQFGTRVDFLPIVLGNGNIRLEVRPRVSEIDESRSVTVNGFAVPGLRTREVDTGVEMKPGQTLALAGLVQTRLDATKSGLPYLSDMPYIGGVFSRKRQQSNEVELLIMVTPELVEALDPCDKPPCLPGAHTTEPSNSEFYWKNVIEKPACGPCGDAVRGCGACQQSGGSPSNMPMAPGETMMPGSTIMQSAPRNAEPIPAGRTMPDVSRRELPATSARQNSGGRALATDSPPSPPAVSSVARTNPTRVQNPPANSANGNRQSPPGLIGPVGYDVINK